MRRREFIARLGAAGGYEAVSRLAHAQQGTRVRRVAILMQVADTPGGTALLAALRSELVRLGWVEGRNLQIDLRFGSNDPGRLRANATELIGLAPDMIVVNGTSMVRMVQQQTQTIPIVTFTAGDVLVRGLVKNPAHPEGNTTGVTDLFQSLAGKWVELLKEAVPRLQHNRLEAHPEAENGLASRKLSEAESGPTPPRGAPLAVTSALDATWNGKEKPTPKASANGRGGASGRLLPKKRYDP
jgi:putative tryptophan/tyrosine transport system substrate-binding protein